MIVLRYLLEYTPGEIARLLDLPRGTVNSRLRRGARRAGREAGGRTVNERDLGRALRDVELPRPRTRERALAVVRAAFADRERVRGPVATCARSPSRPPRRRSSRARSVRPAWPCSARCASRRAQGREAREPRLVALPARTAARPVAERALGRPGRRLEAAARRLRDSSWSPHGLFVVAARGTSCSAVEPRAREVGTCATPTSFPRWAGTETDTRIAYLPATASESWPVTARTTRELCGGLEAAQVPPAWKPGRGLQLAYVSGSAAASKWSTPRRAPSRGARRAFPPCA